MDDIPALLDNLYAEKPFDLDALLCSNDVVAMGAMKWLRGRGLRIPDDVAVAGRDEVEVAAAMVPPLATVNWREPEVAQAIDEMLTARLADPDLPVQTKEVPHGVRLARISRIRNVTARYVCRDDTAQEGGWMEYEVKREPTACVTPLCGTKTVCVKTRLASGVLPDAASPRG